MENLVPQPDGLYALTFKNYKLVPDEEVREIFEEYGDIVSIRKSSGQYPWVFIRYRNYDEAHKAFRGLQNCERFDIRVATSGRKIMDKGSDEKEKGATGETQDKGAKVYREKNSCENHSLSENSDDISRSKEQSKFSGGRNRNFSKNSPGEDGDDDQDSMRNKTQISHNRKSTAHSPKGVDEMEGKRNHSKTVNKFTNANEDNWDDDNDVGVEAAGSSLKQLSVHGNSRHWKGKNDNDEVAVKPSHGNARHWKGKNEDGEIDVKPPHGNARHWKGRNEDDDIDVKSSHGNVRHWKGKNEGEEFDVKPLHGNPRYRKGKSEDGDNDIRPLHGNVRHRKGKNEDDEIDVKPYDEGPPKLVRATEYYGALTLQHPYESGLACRAVFNEVWANHPLRKEMELHEVVITNFDAIPTKKDIMRLCSRVTPLHVSIDVTPKNMPYCRVLVATEEEAEELYELDGCYFDGSPLYVSSLGYILDELAA